MDDDGTTVWDKLTGCSKCSTDSFGACGTATKIFNQATCPATFLAKKQAKENDWSCSVDTKNGPVMYKLTGTNNEKERNISWVYGVAATALVIACLNMCGFCCLGGYLMKQN
jgi:hypothetical protein